MCTVFRFYINYVPDDDSDDDSDDDMPELIDENDNAGADTPVENN